MKEARNMNFLMITSYPHLSTTAFSLRRVDGWEKKMGGGGREVAVID